MTPTLRKLYHRRGKLLSYLNEIDRQIEELTPQKGDLVVYDDGDDCFIRHLHFTPQRERVIRHLTILEKGFER